MGKYLPQKGKVRENNKWHKALIIFRRPFLFEANISPYKPQADEMTYLSLFMIYK